VTGAFNRSGSILVWGIAGASLGMEIAKSLSLAGYHSIIGCDISPLAYGHYSEIFQATYTLDQNSLEASFNRVLKETKPNFVLPGGDQVARLIGTLGNIFDVSHCHVVGNDPSVVESTSDKFRVIERLKELGFPVPETRLLESLASVADFPLPAVLKPRFDSGGSRGVFVVSKTQELQDRAEVLLEQGVPYVLQAYLSEAAGEYTIGVLSCTDRSTAGSIVMQRTFQNLLSVHDRGANYLISSGSSQGIFRRDRNLQRQAEAIASAIESTGPLNIQGRVVGDTLFPFEINPRFSASTYLRALSGVNEVDLYLQHLISGEAIHYPMWRQGLALRSFAEVFVDSESDPNLVL